MAYTLSRPASRHIDVSAAPRCANSHPHRRGFGRFRTKLATCELRLEEFDWSGVRLAMGILRSALHEKDRGGVSRIRRVGSERAIADGCRLIVRAGRGPTGPAPQILCGCSPSRARRLLRALEPSITGVYWLPSGGQNGDFTR